MKMLFVADLHYSLKQFDWLTANAANHDAVVIGGDLLDLSSSLDIDVQIVVVEKYLNRIRQQTRLLVCSGNHDGDSRNAADESVAKWLLEAKAAQLFVDGDCVEISDTLVTVCPWWDGPVSRASLEELLVRDAAREKKTWVWIHHAPPHESPVSWTGKKFAGDACLREWIHKYEPHLVLSGHIHNAPFYAEGSWIYKMGKTWVFNPGKQIGPSPTCISLNFETMVAEWLSIEGQATQQLTESANCALSAAGDGA